ncbi:MAG: hypothetical protein ABSG41_26915 [Bryobacteraceae bacterium]
MMDHMSQTMTGPMVDVTAMNVIVALALLFAAVFVAAWAASPRLRAWIEKPNYRFQKNARTYDEGLMSERTRL